MDQLGNTSSVFFDVIRCHFKLKTRTIWKQLDNWKKQYTSISNKTIEEVKRALSIIPDLPPEPTDTALPLCPSDAEGETVEITIEDDVGYDPELAVAIAESLQKGASPEVMFFTHPAASTAFATMFNPNTVNGISGAMDLSMDDEDPELAAALAASLQKEKTVSAALNNNAGMFHVVFRLETY